MKKNSTLKTLLVGLLALGATSAWGEKVTLTPTADTYFSWTNANNSYGDATSLYCGIWQEMWTNATPGLKGSTSNIAVFKFDVSSYKGKITSATFNVTATNPSTNSNTRSIYLGYFDLTDWTETSTASNSGMATRDAKNLNIHPFGISQPIAKGVTKEVSFTNDGFLTYLNEDEDGIVSLIIYGLGQECSVNSKEAETGNPQLVLSYTNETLYTATFNETNDLEPTITIYSDAERTAPVTNGTLVNGSTYYYTATLAGYNDAKGSFKVNGENPSVSITMEAKTSHTFTVNAVCDGTIIQTIYTDNNSYDGKIHAISLPKYITTEGNLVTHIKADNAFYTSFTALDEDEIKEITYTAYEGTAYFVEAENVISATNYNSGNCSNNGAVRGFTTPKFLFSVPTSGKYDITYAVCNNNVNYDLTCSLYKNETVIASKDNLKSVSINYILTTGTVTNTGISLASGDNLNINFSTTNGIVDYILIERKGDVDPITVTITAAGYATYCSEYALDFSNVEGLTAYTASLSDAEVSFTPVTGAIPANTGVLLKGAAGTYQIPVVANNSSNVTSALVGVNEAEEVTGGIFVLMNGSEGVGFYKTTAANFTVGAHTAYIPALQNTSRSFIAIDEATAIKTIEKTEQSDEIYNLAGQRVKSAQKGLYIIGGKKVVIK